MKKLVSSIGSKLKRSPSSANRKIGLIAIYRKAWATFRGNFWRFMMVSTVVLLTSSIIKAYDVSVSQNSDVALILYVASLFTFAALVWMNFNAKSKGMRFDRIYVASSSRFLPLLLVSLMQMLMAGLAIVGVFIFLLSTAAGLGWWLAVVGAVLIGVALWLLVRYSLAGIVVICQPISGPAALKTSRRLTKNSFWRLTGAYISFFLLIGLFAGLALELFVRLPKISQIWFFQGLVNGILLSLIVPLMVVFAANIYQVLDGKSTS